ncbi:hypothetical protein TNCV_2524031 [Trichonephila clavipes]|nr:hypothetical protein TNCV_2524031 [Trichonephila clavipes]
MANYSKCHLYPKPRKGSNTTPNNYSTAVDSLIRPNTSFAQAAAPSNTRRNPAISYQKQTNQIVTPTPIINNATYEGETFPTTIYPLPTPAHRGYDRSSHPPTSIPFLLFQSTSGLDRTRDCSLMISNSSSRPTVTACDFWRSKCHTQRVELLSQFHAKTSNTLDIAVINNFNFLFTIDSIPELSTDHNPVFLNFSLTTPIHSDNSRAVTTCWSEFRNNLKKSVRLSDFSGIRNPNMCWKKKILFSPPPYAPPTTKRLSQ